MLGGGFHVLMRLEANGTLYTRQHGTIPGCKHLAQRVHCSVCEHALFRATGAIQHLLCLIISQAARHALGNKGPLAGAGS
jgi:hypothetical protein